MKKQSPESSANEAQSNDEKMVVANLKTNARQIAERIANAIEDYAQKAYDDGHRSHLGASLIGSECSRKLWYTFRWVKAEQFDGRQLRLFQRGHLEENRFIEYLRGIGCTVWEFDPNAPAELDKSKKQIRVTGVHGHFGGSCDGVAKLPESWQIDEPVLTEYKTNGTGAGFAKLCKDGVKIAKPQHYAQMCVYGYKLGLKFALYMNVNKNDDSLHVEIVSLDWQLGEQMERKAEAIILSQTAPPRLSENPAYFECKFCSFNAICHYKGEVEKNCRSCQFAVPSKDATWDCLHHGATIPKDFLKGGCGEWKSIA